MSITAYIRIYGYSGYTRTLKRLGEKIYTNKNPLFYRFKLFLFFIIHEYFKNSRVGHEQATSGLSEKITFYLGPLIRAGYRFADVKSYISQRLKRLSDSGFFSKFIFTLKRLKSFFRNVTSKPIKLPIYKGRPLKLNL